MYATSVKEVQLTAKTRWAISSNTIASSGVMKTSSKQQK